jgi:hypothetical protein
MPPDFRRLVAAIERLAGAWHNCWHATHAEASALRTELGILYGCGELLNSSLPAVEWAVIAAHRTQAVRYRGVGYACACRALSAAVLQVIGDANLRLSMALDDDLSVLSVDTKRFTPAFQVVADSVRRELGRVGGNEFRELVEAAWSEIAAAAVLSVGRADPPAGGRLAFDDETLTVTLDGRKHKVDDPKAYHVYKAIARRDTSAITKTQVQSKVKGVAGQKTIPALIKSLPLALKQTVKVDTRGYWHELPTIRW